MGLFSIFKASPPRGTVTRDEMRDIIAEAMEGANVENGLQSVIKISSQVHSLVTTGEAFAAVRDSQTFYIPGRSVCVDTVWKAKARIIEQQGRGKFGDYHAAFGMLWTLTHAVNIYISDKRKMTLIDNDGSLIQPRHLAGPVDLIVI